MEISIIVGGIVHCLLCVENIIENNCFCEIFQVGHKEYGKYLLGGPNVAKEMLYLIRTDYQLNNSRLHTDAERAAFLSREKFIH